MMTTKTITGHAPEGGTIRAASDADRRVTVARAQAELIDMLARLVLAAVEQGAEAQGRAARREITKDQSVERRKRRRRGGAT